MRKVLILFLFLASPSLQAQEYQLAKPIVRVEGGPFFEKSTTVSCEFRLEGAVMRYTLDDSEPTKRSKAYKKPLKISKTTTVKVKVFIDGFQASETVRLDLFKLKSRLASVKLTPNPKSPYQAEAGKTLTDQKAGSFNFRDGHWVGYNEGPVTIEVDLGKVVEKERLVLSTLVSPDSWIMRPERLSYTHSLDGIHFEKEAWISMIPMASFETAYKRFYQLGMDGPYRYVRITINPVAALPEWHPGKGQPGWVFIDEILVQ